ncbi:armadillo repeat-containing protein 1 isoform X2 [Chamaea fasciata]|uniref:armadillo repeat-containing protein 1 isoform X2 n=1 Tax=Chamaea fasciata TaxID=190680 RepID=UPI00336AAE21
MDQREGRVSGLQPLDYTSRPAPRPPRSKELHDWAKGALETRQSRCAVFRCAGSERAAVGGAGALVPVLIPRFFPGLLPCSPRRSPQAAPPRGTWRRGAELLVRPQTASATVFCMNGAAKMNSAMSEEPDALSVVNQLRDLAADPLNRRAIVQDQGCLPGLILFLDHPNPQVVHSALLALRYLAECRVNREKMKSELGMMLSLQNVIQKTTTPGETKLLASEVYDILQSSNMSDMDNVNEMNYRRRKAQFFLGSTNKRAKTVVLHIDGLDDSSRRNLCEEALLKIKGVISFTFQMAVQRCVVRIRSDLKAEALATAIASTKVMKAQQVVKSESGEEMLVPFQDTPVEVEQNTDLPEYLPEDESPTKEQDKAVSRVGSHPEGAASWLSTAANFLSRSFYW